MNNIELNPQFANVLNFVNQTDHLIFLTGKAGTGKTTLLKYIKEHTMKQMAVVAPTGVAAINAGGSTIHSFFQFPFTPFLPALKDNGDQDFSKSNLPVLKYSAQRLAIFRKLELLVIDEISMVRADLLDQVDITLRQTRRKWHQPFGGVQVMLIGDMHQLPPVVQPEEWSLLAATYPSPYFFDSLVVRNNRPVYIELDKIYRQKEQDFIDLLNQVRNNRLDRAGFEKLNAHYRPDLPKEFIRDNITLTTHNRKADAINLEQLAALSGKEYVFSSRVEGSFNEKNYPAEEKLVLKEGARVMFLKNNTEKNYYNGKIGVVTVLEKDRICVKCEEDRSEIEVGKETWTNVSYTVNKQSKGLEEEIIGTFSQFPLRLAWAITIHKSQGLSFDKVIIDAASSFTAGQVYVALSRCRGLSGLTLSSRISESVLISDKSIQNFSSTRQGEEELAATFSNSRRHYLRSLLTGLFDFSEAQQERKDLGGLMQTWQTRLRPGAQDWVNDFVAGIDKLYDLGSRFRDPLSAMIAASPQPEDEGALQKRVIDASAYFHKDLEALLSMFKALPAFTESRETAEELNPILQKLFEELFMKNELMKACTKGFYLNIFLEARAKIVFPNRQINIYETARNSAAASDVTHPELYRRLLLLRDAICNDEHKPIFIVASSKTLKELANFLPQDTSQLMKISGFGEAKAEAWGDQFLAVIKDYVSENNIVPDMEWLNTKKEKKKKKKTEPWETTESSPSVKKSSPEQTFELFKQGLSLQEIAIARKLSQGTLESHLVPFVASGDIQLEKLVSKEKIELIETALADFNKAVGLSTVKGKLGDAVTYSEIRYVLAHKTSAEGS